MESTNFDELRRDALLAEARKQRSEWVAGRSPAKEASEVDLKHEEDARGGSNLSSPSSSSELQGVARELDALLSKFDGTSSNEQKGSGGKVEAAGASGSAAAAAAAGAGAGRLVAAQAKERASQQAPPVVSPYRQFLERLKRKESFDVVQTMRQFVQDFNGAGAEGMDELERKWVPPRLLPKQQSRRGGGERAAAEGAGRENDPALAYDYDTEYDAGVGGGEGDEVGARSRGLSLRAFYGAGGNSPSSPLLTSERGGRIVRCFLDRLCAQLRECAPWAVENDPVVPTAPTMPEAAGLGVAGESGAEGCKTARWRRDAT